MSTSDAIVLTNYPSTLENVWYFFIQGQIKAIFEEKGFEIRLVEDVISFLN